MESRNEYWWTYLEGRNRDADTENRPVDSGEEEDGTNGESRMKYIHYHM